MQPNISVYTEPIFIKFSDFILYFIELVGMINLTFVLLSLMGHFHGNQY